MSTSDNKSPIPIKNIFYMLCYAWNVLGITDTINVDLDSYEDAYNLLARVFSFGIGKLIRLGFHRSYIVKEEELPTVKGKVLVQQSISSLSFMKKRLVCSYDEYSKNDIFNQILKYTLDSILKSTQISGKIKKSVVKQRFFFDGIDPVPPTKANRQKLFFNRNNLMYKLLINIAIMLYENSTLNEEQGEDVFKDFYRQEQMHRVFELFILNFYSTHLDKRIYRVHAPKISWHIASETIGVWENYFDVDTNPGDRRTDIVIENRNMRLQMIFDAKYYKNTFVNAYMNSSDLRIRRSHLDQVRGYLLDSEFHGNKCGALLYPTVNTTENRIYPLENTPIIIKTINLNTEWKNIHDDMLTFVRTIEEGQNALVLGQV